MSPPRPQVSVVVPLLNEATTVVDLVQRVSAVLGERGDSFEIVFVDDGSTDGTVEVLREMERNDASVRVYEFTRNFGQAAALACGLREARGEVVVTIDGDLQNPPEEIPKLLAVIEEGAWIATGRRSVRYEQPWRWLGSRFVHWVARALVGADIDDFGGQFKAYRREVVEATQKLWAPGKPFFPLALWLGFPVCEVSVRHDPRRSGRSRYGFASLLRINLDLIISFTTVPLVALAVAGAVLFLVGIAAVAICIVGGATDGFAAVLSLVLFTVGSVFLACGIVGLYVARIYRMVSTNNPGYVLREKASGADTRDRPLRAAYPRRS